MTRVDRYDLLGLLGQGSFGSVHRARHVHTGQEVALKLAKAAVDPEVKVLMASGADARAFAAGADIAEFEEIMAAGTADDYFGRMMKATRALAAVGIPDAERRFFSYPHQMSGGMRQRVMIAMALACKPKVLLADEPTTALDVTIQAQILGLLADLKEARGMAVVFITHNLGVVAQIADRVAVMYAGQIVETADVREIFARPMHPYTEALLRAMPRVDQDTESLQPIAGAVPAITAMPAGCAYASRCPLRQSRCESTNPELAPIGATHDVRCLVRAESVRKMA